MEITPGNIMLIVAILLFFSVLVGKAGSKYGIFRHRNGGRC